MFNKFFNPTTLSFVLLAVFAFQLVFAFQSKAGTVVVKSLNVPYINQCLQKDGAFLYPNMIGSEANRQICKNMCLTSASVMVAAFFGKINYNGNTDVLKEALISDPDIPERVKNGNLQIGGAFALTSYPGANGDHIDNHAQGLIDYAKRKGLDTNGIQWIPADKEQARQYIFNQAKASIDRGNPMIMSTKTHARVIIGYTNDGKVLVHDSFRNTNIGPSGGYFNRDGNSAIYDIPETYTSRTYIPREQFQYMIEFKQASNTPATRTGQTVEVVNSANNASWTTINARAGIAGNVVAEVPFGTTGQVLSRPIFANGYFREEVQFNNGVKGWMATNFLKSYTPVASTDINKTVTASEFLVIRDKPGVNGATRGVVNPNTKGTMTKLKNDKVDGYKWGFIKWSDGREGWSASEFVK
jgi:Peptidase_C39 like family